MNEAKKCTGHRRLIISHQIQLIHSVCRSSPEMMIAKNKNPPPQNVNRWPGERSLATRPVKVVYDRPNSAFKKRWKCLMRSSSPLGMYTKEGVEYKSIPTKILNGLKDAGQEGVKLVKWAQKALTKDGSEPEPLEILAKCSERLTWAGEQVIVYTA